MPRTREGVAAYFEEYRPRLIGSPVAQDMMDFLLDVTPLMLDGVLPRPASMPISAVVRRAVIATMPRWMREMAGIKQTRAMDVAVAVPIKVAVRAMAIEPRLQMAVVKRLSPLTVPIVAPILKGVPAEDFRVWTPAEAYAHFELPTPREQYADMLARRGDGRGPQPYAQHHHERPVDFPVDRAVI